MNPLKSIARGYNRWRHRRGFGVHSPFAYRMVRDVLTSRGHYYAVVRFRRDTAGLPRKTIKEYAVLFRLVARLAPRRINLAGSVEMQLYPVLRLADSRVLIAEGTGGYSHCDRVLTILSASDIRHTLPDGILRSGNMLVIRNLKEQPTALETVLGAVTGGWVFADSRTAIIVSDSDEPLNMVDVTIL